MSPSTLSSTNDLSTKEITLKSLMEEIQLFRQNKSRPNDPLPEGIWNQLHVLLMKHSLTECARELNLTRIQVERELIVALKKVGPKPSQSSLCPKAPEVSVETTAAFQEIEVREKEAAPSVLGLVSVQNQDSRPVQQATPMVAAKALVVQNEPPKEPSALPTVGVPSALKKPTKEHPEATTPLNYKAAKAFSTKTAVVEIKRPDGMLMAISICTDRFEELLSAFFKGYPA
jgi:hypothetical protein